VGRLFGTDGVRGVAGRDLTARLAMDLAIAAAAVLDGMGAFAQARAVRRRPIAVVGRDPRASGEFLEAAVVAGLASAGVDVLTLGVVPTPAVAYLTADLDAEIGVMLSASHNPAPDNGIKLFTLGGLKLPDAVEDQIELRLRAASGPQAGLAGDVAGLAGDAAGLAGGSAGLAEDSQLPADGFGRVRDASGEVERYLAHLLATLPGSGAGLPAGPLPLAGLRVVVDCAHGAASELAPRLLRRAGADVLAIGAEPDGLNINDGCGSTSLDVLAAAVTQHRADAGIAHDGDADRCLAVDADGQLIDGDQILAVLALALRDAGQLAGDTVVTTVMANLGFRTAMRAAGIDVVETPVGDRYVLEAMREGKFTLGGEQSGHVILLDHATTGDGLLTALQLLSVMARRGLPLRELAQAMTKYPQVLINVPGVDKALAASSGELAAAVIAAEAELGTSGRVLVRPSGTEHAVRVMVEALDAGQAHRVAERLADTVRDLT
jgi:phosphoglucosamine mutase